MTRPPINYRTLRSKVPILVELLESLVSSVRTTWDAFKFRRASIHTRSWHISWTCAKCTHHRRSYLRKSSSGMHLGRDASGTSTQRTVHLWIESWRSPLATFPLCDVTCEEFRLRRKPPRVTVKPRKREKTGAQCTLVTDAISASRDSTSDAHQVHGNVNWLLTRKHFSIKVSWKLC